LQLEYDVCDIARQLVCVVMVLFGIRDLLMSSCSFHEVPLSIINLMNVIGDDG